MSFGYAGRLLCLSLASFFLVFTSLNLLISLLAPLAIGFAERRRPRLGALLLLAVRLLPLAGGLLFVGILCVPSYLRLEPALDQEQAGPVSVVIALLGVVLCSVSLAASVRALRKSASFFRPAQETKLPGWAGSAGVIEGPASVLALTGVLHSRLVISRELLSALTAPELDIALRHEKAHLQSRDNLKRLLILLSPNLIPFLPGVRAMERSWARLTEWAADDRAVAGDYGDSILLADVLVRCARMRRPPEPLLTSSLLCCNGDLSARVDRLLGRPEPSHTSSAVPVATAALAAAGLGALALHPAILHAVHHALELLLD